MTGSPDSSTRRICASIDAESRPGCTSASRSPSRRSGGPPPNRARAALDHTKRRSVLTMAMPIGESPTICSSTERLMFQPGASDISFSRASQRAGPPGSWAEVRRTMTGTGRPSLRRADSSPAQPPSSRHRARTSGTRPASARVSSAARSLPTASAAGYPSSRSASLVQLVTTPRSSSSRGAVSATSNRRRAVSSSSSMPTAGLSVAESGLPPPDPIFTLPAQVRPGHPGRRGTHPHRPRGDGGPVRRPASAPAPTRPAPRPVPRR